MKKVVIRRTDIAFYIKLFPLDMHRDAYRKAKAIQCAKSLQLLEDAFLGREIPDPECSTSDIDNNVKLAGKLGLTGVPVVIIEDGRVFNGLLKAEQIITLIDEKN